MSDAVKRIIEYVQFKSRLVAGMKGFSLYVDTSVCTSLQWKKKKEEKKNIDMKKKTFDVMIYTLYL